MRNSLLTDVMGFESRDGADVYFTSRDLNDFETALAEAMSELDEAGLLQDDGAWRDACRLRLGAAIIRHASGGERDIVSLRRAALRSVFSPRMAWSTS